MLYRVIISHRQSVYLDRFPKIKETSVVFDDPTQEDITACNALGYTPVVVLQPGNRGSNRNAGLNHILDTYNPEDGDIIEFLDGDRYPISDYSTDAVSTLIQKDGLDCLLYACGGKDVRLSKLSVPLIGSLVVDTGTLCNPFYSCGFSIKVSAIRQVIDFNGGYFFNPRFTGWGCEDQYMGLVCSHLEHKVAITREIILNGNVGGDSDFHTEYKQSLQTYIDLIRENDLVVRNAPLF